MLRWPGVLFGFLAFLANSSPPSLVACTSSTLRPSEIEALPIFSAWASTESIELPGLATPLKVREGVISYPPPLDLEIHSKLQLLPGVMPAETVEQILQLLNHSGSPPWDTDPDSIDGMTSHELYLTSDETYGGAVRSNSLKGDFDEEIFKNRQPLRDALSGLIDPIVDHQIIPFLRQRYPAECNGSPERACRVCSSVVRKYLPGSRRGVAIHRDQEARVTVVISLSDYEREYRGGLYVSSGSSHRQLLALNRGDAAIHQTDLMHGVKLSDATSERWSLILWIRDSASCSNHNEDWHKECAADGNPVCQFLYGQAIAHDPRTPAGAGVEKMREGLSWIQKSAKAGHVPALTTITRVVAGQNAAVAMEWYQRNVDQHNDAESALALAQLKLEKHRALGQLTRTHTEEVVGLLGIAARGGAEVAQYNLGVAHMHGYGAAGVDRELAKEWFEECNMPEGMLAMAQHYSDKGRKAEAHMWTARAEDAGWGKQHYTAAMERAKRSQIMLPWPHTYMDASAWASSAAGKVEQKEIKKNHPTDKKVKQPEGNKKTQEKAGFSRAEQMMKRDEMRRAAAEGRRARDRKTEL